MSICLVSIFFSFLFACVLPGAPGVIATGDRNSGVSFYLCCTPQVYKNYTNTVSKKQGMVFTG